MENVFKVQWQPKPVQERNREVLDYFQPKAVNYDETDGQDYWAFSDRLLWSLLQDNVLEPIKKEKENFSFFDAGCGTARWSSRILQAYPAATGILGDLTPNMLQVAKDKVERMGASGRVVSQEMDLNKLASYNVPKVNLVICFHNVLSFVSDPAAVIAALYDQLNDGGRLCLVIPNLYHAASFSALAGNLTEAERASNTASVKFTETVPEMWVFTPEKIAGIFGDLGAAQSKVMGFPVTVYPQKEETEIRGNSNQAKRIFSDEGNVKRLFEIEKRLCPQQEAAARGNNLLCIATKPKKA